MYSAEDLNKIKPKDEQSDWVLAFCRESADERQDIEGIWEEVERNFLVQTADEWGFGGTSNPLNLRFGRSILKDPETHQEIMTIASKLAAALFPDGTFVNAKGVGFEDIPAGLAVANLEHYFFRLPGHYMAAIEWILNVATYGTGITECYWDIVVEPRVRRRVTMEPLSGIEMSVTSVEPVAIWDDPRLCPISPWDFFPPSSARDMLTAYGAAKRFRISPNEALRRVARGLYEAGPTKRALQGAVKTDDLNSSGITNEWYESCGLVGYEYIGETDFRTDSDDPTVPSELTSRRVITVLGDTTVRSEIWPRRTPFFDTRIIPRCGSQRSFWGISPGEVIRHDQDFADVLKMMLADAVVRATNPPHIYNKYAEVDVAKLRAFSPNVPIGANSVEAIQQVPYNPPVGPTFNMYAGVKTQMREASGALGSIQGLGLGIDRASATEAQATFQQAMDRPELFASIIERNDLPQLARYVLELYQEFLPDNDPSELARRVGASTAPVKLADISLPFDIEFIGSRQQGTRQQKLLAYREIVASAANPIISQLTPWVPLLRKWYEEMGAPEVAAMIGNPEWMQLNMMLTQLGGNQGSQAAPMPSPGMLPAQEMGG